MPTSHARHALLPVLAAALSAWSAVHAADQPVVLQGSLKETVYRQATQPVAWSPQAEGGGQVLSAPDRRPMSGVQVTIPDLNYRTVSGPGGRFSLPPLPGKPTIVAFEKAGYLPATATLDRDQARRQPLQVYLQKPGNALVLDAEIRHLGDGSYSPVSAGAGQFRRASSGPVLERRFMLNAPPGNTPAVLEIGSIIGLDTLAARMHGQSRFHRFSTPMRVKVNGLQVGEIHLNGDGVRMSIPPGVLIPGANVLRIETGFTVPDGQYVDFDDMELMLITLRWQAEDARFTAVDGD